MNINKNLKSTKLFVIAAIIGCTIFGSGVATAADYTIDVGDTLDNYGSINAAGGTFTNKGTLNNIGTSSSATGDTLFLNDTTGVIVNEGTVGGRRVTNDGTMTNSGANSKLHAYSVINNNILNNDGKIQ